MTSAYDWLDDHRRRDECPHCAKARKAVQAQRREDARVVGEAEAILREAASEAP